MGLDYSFNIGIRKPDKPMALKMIEEHSSTFKEDQKSTVESIDVVLILKEDDQIKEYYQSYFERLPPRYRQKSDSPEYFRVDDNHFRVGYIYIYIHEQDNQEDIELRFTAATTGMSRLFNTSTSVMAFFQKFCERLNAQYGYLDMEHNGTKSIWPLN